MGYFSIGEVVLAHHRFDQTPFVQRVLANLSLAILTEVFKLRLVRVAHFAKVLEVNIDDEVFWDNLIFILANVLGTQLHLSGLNVVTTLNEGGVKHDPEHNLI